MTTILNLGNQKAMAFYNKSLANFRAQFKDVASIQKLYVNASGKVYAGEWLDSQGVINFNGGYAPDLAKTIIFKPVS